MEETRVQVPLSDPILERIDEDAEKAARNRPRQIKYIVEEYYRKRPGMCCACRHYSTLAKTCTAGYPEMQARPVDDPLTYPDWCRARKGL